MVKIEKIQGYNYFKNEKIQRYKAVRFFFIPKVEKPNNPCYSYIESVKNKRLWKKKTIL